MYIYIYIHYIATFGVCGGGAPLCRGGPLETPRATLGDEKNRGGAPLCRGLSAEASLQRPLREAWQQLNDPQ